MAWTLLIIAGSCEAAWAVDLLPNGGTP